MQIEVLNKLLPLNINPQQKMLWVNIYEQMIVHTRKVKPKKLLEIVRPNEPADIIKYRVDTYMAITQDPILKALNSTYHLIKQSDYKVIAPDVVNDYIRENKFNSFISVNKLDIYDLIFKSFLQLSTEDPNGIIFVDTCNPDSPLMPPTDVLRRVGLTVNYVHSKDIKYVDENLLVYQTGEILLGKALTPTYRVVNDTHVYLYIPVRLDDKSRVVYELQPWYNHELGFVPFRFLGGIETIATAIDEKTYAKKEIEYKLFDTFFTAYNSWANKAIIASSETDAVKARFSFPIMEVLGTPCRTCDGRKEVWDCTDKLCSHDTCHKVSCKTCNGVGIIQSFSPYSVIVKPPPIPLDGNVATDFSTVKFYSPPYEAVTLNKEYWYEMMDKAEQSISVYQTRNVQSGVAKEIDLEQKRDFISVIGDNEMNLLEFTLKCFAGYLQADGEVKIIKPTKYELRSKEGIIAEISSVSKVDLNLAKSLSKEYIEKEYDGVEKRIMEVIIDEDVLYGYTLADISSVKAMMVLNDSDFTFHFKAYTLLSEIINEDNITLSNEQIMKLVNDKITRAVTERE